MTSSGERAAAFAREVVRPWAPAMARGEGPSPRDVVRVAGEYGLAGLLAPVSLGGAGADHSALVEVIEAIARECASTAVILDVHLSVASEPVLLFGDEVQRSRFAPLLASGAWLGAFCLTEPAGGSDAAAMQARAVRDGDSYVLNGVKTFITSGDCADLYVVVARLDDGISCFLVEAGSTGLSFGEPFVKLGLHGSRTGEVVLSDVRVPVAHRLGAEGVGFRVAMTALDSGRLGISAQATGIALGCLDDIRSASAGERDVFAVADVAARTVAAGVLARDAARLLDAGERVTPLASVAKLWSTDTCVFAASVAVDLCAPESGSAAHPAAVRLCDAKACQIYEGTNQIQRVVIARGLLRG